MATTVQAVCTFGCGEVDVESQHLELWVSTAHPESSHYTFTCPACTKACVRSADANVQRKLVDGGFLANPYEPPAEIFEAHPGGPLTSDHVLDLMLAVDHYNLTGEGAPWSTTPSN